MTTDKPELETLGYKPNNSPNKEIVIVNNILSWSKLINEGLEILRTTAKNEDQKYAVSEALEQMDIFQRVDAHRLRKAFE